MSFVLIVLGWIFFSEALILILSRDRSPKPTHKPLTHILVLGANGDENSPVNRERAQKALEAKKLYPNATIVVTGNEKTRGEVTALLKNMGEHAGRAIKEEFSRTTWENLENSRAFLAPNSHALIVTSGFHSQRAVAAARLLGLEASAPDSSVAEPIKVGWWTRERAAIAFFVLGFIALWSRRYFKR